MNKGLGEKAKRGLCKVCGKYAGRRCSGCGCIFYCSVEHQRNDWQRHKNECKEFRKARDGAKVDAKKSKNTAVHKDQDRDLPEGSASSKEKQQWMQYRCSQCLYGPPHKFDHALAQIKLVGFTCYEGMVCNECWDDVPSSSSISSSRRREDPLKLVGRAVELYGLRSKEWNGRKCIVLAAETSLQEGKGPVKLGTIPARYAVQVGDGSKPVKIKPENLRLLEKEEEHEAEGKEGQGQPGTTQRTEADTVPNRVQVRAESLARNDQDQENLKAKKKKKKAKKKSKRG